MNIKTHDVEKKEIAHKLCLVKNIISTIIDQMETGLDWKLAHKQLEVAITQLKSVTRQLAVHHLVVCVAKKLKIQQDQENSKQNISEFIKTYNYLH